MHHKFLIPLDQSKKEYIKFYNLYHKTKLWDKFYFLLDFNFGNIDIKNIFYLNNIKYSKQELIKKSDYIIRSFGFNNIDEFSILEYEQNKGLFRSKSSHRLYLRKLLIALDLFFNQNDLSQFTIFMGAVSHFYPRAILYLSKIHNVNLIMYTQSLVPGKEFVIVDTEMFESYKLKKLFNHYRYNENDKLLIKEIKDQVINGKLKKTYLADYKLTLKKEIIKFNLIASRFRLKFLNHRRLYYFINKLIIRKVCALIWYLFSTNKIPSSKFVFFPLHMPNEAQLFIRGNGFIAEHKLIKPISSILKGKYLVLVKEHPGYEGWKSLKELFIYVFDSNVVLLNSKISSHDIIKKSNAVITINSSVWFESLFFEKPVITFGKGIFSGFKITKEMEDVSKFKDEMIRIKFDFSKFVSDEKNIINFLKSYSLVSIDGFFYKPLLNGDLSFFKSFFENIMNIKKINE